MLGRRYCSGRQTIGRANRQLFTRQTPESPARTSTRALWCWVLCRFGCCSQAPKLEPATKPGLLDSASPGSLGQALVSADMPASGANNQARASDAGMPSLIAGGLDGGDARARSDEVDEPGAEWTGHLGMDERQTARASDQIDRAA